MAYGSGHTMAAQAIVDALSVVSPGLEVIHHDGILSSRSWLERFPASFYIFTNKHAHWIWRTFYYSPVFRTRLANRLTSLLFSRGIIGRMRDIAPDAVVSTHLSSTRASLKLRLPTFSVITDYCFHPFLFSEGVCAYFAASDEVREALVSQGFPRERIYLTGIPIRRMFWEPPSAADSRERIGLPRDQRIVLLMSGNQGVTPVGKIAKILKGSEAFLVVVTGKNETMRRRMESLFREKRIEGMVTGVFLDMALLLSACDIIVTKGGGIITSECLACGLPMVFYDSIPGQEEGNARIISEWGAGVRARSADEAAALVKDIINDPTRLKRMKEKALEHGRPKAALDIAEKVLSLLGVYHRAIPPKTP